MGSSPLSSEAASLASEVTKPPTTACAVGETVILLTTPVLSLLKQLIQVQGGCHQMTVSPTATTRLAAHRLDPLQRRVFVRSEGGLRLRRHLI